MALEGTLEDFSLADIFQLIGIQRKTGVLTLKNSLETVTVTFFNGMVVGADTSPKKLEDRIGKVLVKTGLISQDQLREALEYQKKTMQKIGFILVDQSYISKGQLKQALQIQVTQMIYRLFRWNTGEYYFDQKARVDPDSDESISPVSAESILMEGIHMIDEWPIIQKRIPSFDAVFKPMLRLEDVELSESEDENMDPLFAAGKGIEPSEKVRLSGGEEAVFRLVDGKNTVAEIIDRSKLGEFHTCKTLYDLLERKIIEPVSLTRRVEREPPKTLTVKVQRGVDLRIVYPVLALIVAGLLFLNLADPMRVAVFRFFQDRDSADLKAGVNSSRIGLVDAAVVMYFYVHGNLPEKLDQLVSEHYLSRKEIVDPWARPYAYVSRGNTYILAAYDRSGRIDEHLQFQRTLNVVEEKKPPKIQPSDSSIRFEN